MLKPVLCIVLSLAATQSLLGDESPVRRLHNEDIRWFGGPLGLQPSFSKHAERIRVKEVAIDVRELVPLLDDPDRFVVAHVLLVELVGVSGTISSGKWHSLHVSLAGLDAPPPAVTYDLKDMPILKKYWQKQLKLKE